MPRTKSRYVDDDDDETDMRDILQDGERMHVPLRLMDSLQRDVAQHIARVTDGSGDVLGLHRPGFRVADASSGAERRRVYDQYDDAVQSEWKNPPTGFGSGGFVGQRAGDLCTIDGEAGHLKKINGELRCVPDKRNKDATAMLDERETAYRTYDDEIKEAWR